MTQRANARLAGLVFLFYIVVGITDMVVFARASSGEGIAARLSSIAGNATVARLTVVLILLQAASAFVLAVTLYALTRAQDRELALMGLCFRVAEGVTGAVSGVGRLGLVSLATAGVAATPAETASAHVLGDLLVRQGGHATLVGATCFAMGSTLFAWLFLRARSIPVWMAWLGIFASALLVVALPAQMAGILRGSMTWYIWMPMLVFEVALALWLIVRGVATGAAR